MLQFDSKTQKLLSACYQGEDFTRRRAANMAALAPVRGECILDLGCGPGLMTAELAEAVGKDGSVIGVDASAGMCAETADRCARFPHVRVIEARAGAVPVPDASLDGAVSLQVMEYVPDVPDALRDLSRAVRPGGRVVIGDMQFDTLSWASDDPVRMSRMATSWDGHVHEPNLPARLPSLLRDAGFRDVGLHPLPMTAIELGQDSLPMMMLHLMAPFAVRKGHLSQEETDAWAAEQKERAAQGRFFFSLTHFIAVAMRP